MFGSPMSCHNGYLVWAKGEDCTAIQPAVVSSAATATAAQVCIRVCLLHNSEAWLDGA